MFNLSDCSSLKGFRFPRSVIGYAVWAYHRFALSLRDVEDLLASRGIKVSYETIRDWVARFGSVMAAKIRKARPKPSDKWHLDEVVRHCQVIFDSGQGDIDCVYYGTS